MKKGFTLIELLVVMAIIAILVGASAALIPSLVNANKFGTNVVQMNSILNEARDHAMALNTYVVVAFTDNLPNVTGGVSVGVFESKDGTRDPIYGTTITPIWTADQTMLASNYQVLFPVKTLTGTILLPSANSKTTVDSVNAHITSVLSTKTGAFLPPVNTAQNNAVVQDIQDGLNWQYATGFTTYKFTRAVVFSPNGECQMSTWTSNSQFALVNAIGTDELSNSALFNVARLTGAVQLFRP